jgi:hypothetical protein
MTESMPLVMGLLLGDVQPLHHCRPKPTTTSQQRVVGKIHPQPTKETRHEIRTPDSTRGQSQTNKLTEINLPQRAHKGRKIKRSLGKGKDGEGEVRK